MFKLLAITALVALAQGSQYEIGLGSFTKIHPKFSPKVVNGDDAELGAFPYQCSLHLAGPLTSTHFCGGQLVSLTTVLTAGHCVTEVNVNPLQHIEILAGLINLKTPGSTAQTSKVARTIVHPDFAGGVAPNDLAIHILATPMKLTDYVKPIGLPEPGSIPNGTATLSGWGSTSHTQTPNMPNNLKKATLPIIDMDTCLGLVEGQDTPLDNTMVCTGPLTGGYGACSGDSGGPLVAEGADGEKTLVGVVSWGFIPCAQANVPSVFTRVSNFNDWIVENTV